jgi:hypothetical protein
MAASAGAAAAGRYLPSSGSAPQLAAEHGHFLGPAVIVVVVVAEAACSKTPELGPGIIVRVVIGLG